VLWADHPLWAQQWQALHPADLVYAVQGSVGTLVAALAESRADGLLLSADAAPPELALLPALAPHGGGAAALVPPLHRGLPLWWVPPGDTQLADWLSTLHHPPSAQALPVEQALAQGLGPEATAWAEHGPNAQAEGGLLQLHAWLPQPGGGRRLMQQGPVETANALVAALLAQAA
jgi:hypothetical protein